MSPEQVVARFRRLVEADGRAGRPRSLAAYVDLLGIGEDVLRPEYERLVGTSGAGPPVDGGLRRGSEIARGSMGAIERVRDRWLHREMALKAMLPERADDADYVRRFLREAQVTAQLDHPGVVPVHQLGRDADGRLFFTMKLVKGRTLRDIFGLARARRDNWSIPRVLQVLIRICETLGFAHERGVIHRDLKPANVMVGRNGEVYVMDWGLAKVGRSRRVRAECGADPDASPAVTMAGDVLGTPSYMPPEQAAGSEIDERADIYAVGAMLYELFTGHPPYGELDRSSAEVVAAALAGPPAPLRRLRPGLPGEILAICDKSMARDAADRHRSADELAQELRDFIEGSVERGCGA